MIFNSNVFLVFLAVVLLGYWLVRNSASHRNLLIFLASMFFYGWWDWRFVGLVLLTGGIDYYVGQRIEDSSDPRRRRHWLWVSLGSNLVTLGFFKYAGFFVDSAVAAFESIGIQVPRPALQIILPAGISFYTFQALGYAIDVYRGTIHAERNFIRYFAFLTFFPQLVAGPIERAADLLTQFCRPRCVSQALVNEGIWWILWGFFQKVVIADSLGPLVDLVYNSREPWRAGVLLGTIAFGGQIYCDFCGYTSIARGVANIFGYHLSTNFSQPYLATNIQNFWRGWHQTLSTWFRDYIYFPLGGDRLGVQRTFTNIVSTFTIAGLWHGANWTFILWGLWHGLALGIWRLWKGTRIGRAVRFPNLLAWMFTMIVVGVGWLFFRATSLHHAGELLGAVAKPGGPGWAGIYIRAVLLAVAVMFAMDLFHRKFPWTAVVRWPLVVRGGIQGILLTFIIARWGKDASPFIYFQF